MKDHNELIKEIKRFNNYSDGSMRASEDGYYVRFHEMETVIYEATKWNDVKDVLPEVRVFDNNSRVALKYESGELYHSLILVHNERIPEWIKNNFSKWRYII